MFFCSVCVLDDLIIQLFSIQKNKEVGQVLRHNTQTRTRKLFRRRRLWPLVHLPSCQGPGIHRPLCLIRKMNSQPCTTEDLPSCRPSCIRGSGQMSPQPSSLENENASSFASQVTSNTYLLTIKQRLCHPHAYL